MKKIDTGIRQIDEEFTVSIEEYNGRIAIVATNEGGGNITSVPLVDLLQWIANNCPRLMIRALRDANEWHVEDWKLDELRGDDPYVANQDDPFDGWDAT